MGRGRAPIVRRAWIVRPREGAVRVPGAAVPTTFLFCAMAAIYPMGFLSNHLPSKMRKKKKIEPEELLAAIADAVDDGFCPNSVLISRFARLSHRDLVRLRGLAARRGLLLERRGPDGQVYLALTSEGWRALRSSRTFSPSTNQTRRPSG